MVRTFSYANVFIIRKVCIPGLELYHTRTRFLHVNHSSLKLTHASSSWCYFSRKEFQCLFLTMMNGQPHNRLPDVLKDVMAMLIIIRHAQWMEAKYSLHTKLIQLINQTYLTHLFQKVVVLQCTLNNLGDFEENSLDHHIDALNPSYLSPIRVFSIWRFFR